MPVLKSEIQSYIDLGIYPFPVRISPSFEEDPDRSIKRKKKPTVPWANFRRGPASVEDMARWWWENEHPLGVGIPTDKLVVVDVDTEDPLETLAEIFERIGIEPPDTRVVRTARLGMHAYFLRNGQNVRNSTSKLAPGVDIRAIGGYVVVPPTGGWERFAGDAIVSVPPELVRAIQEATAKRDDKPAPEKPVVVRREIDPVDAAVGRLLRSPEGERNDALNLEAFRLGSLHAVEDLPGTIDTAAHKLLAAALSIGLERPESEATIRSGFQGGAKALPSRRLTDLGNAERLVDARRESLRFCWGTGWYLWSKTHWNPLPVKSSPVSEYKTVMRSLAEQKVPAQVVEWVRKSESESRVNAACRLAKTDRRIVVTVEELDRDPELLATPSGVVDLRTGKIRDAEPNDLQTKITDVSVDFGKAKRFEKFLVEIFPDLEVLDHVRRYLGYAITGYSREQKIHMWYGSGANGKALALDTLIPTPEGWMTQGALCVGDQVIGDDGWPCTVVALSPVWKDRPCYQMKFSDGAEVVADAAHVWPTFRGLKTTEEIAEQIIRREKVTGRVGREYMHRMSPCEPIDFSNSRELPIDPYVLGYWLGDGSSRCAEITVSSLDLESLLFQVDRAGYFHRVRKNNNGNYTVWVSTTLQKWSRDSLQSRLRRLEVLQNKHVPGIYLRASLEQRLALLHGLMDSDGSTLKTQAQCEYTSVNERLANDVVELVRTLGLVPTINEYRAILEGRDVGPKYRVIFSPPEWIDVFRLERKREICRSRMKPVGRSVVSCEMCPSVPVRCIQVDSKSNRYLCTRSMIPTHNSLLIRVLLHVLGSYAQTAAHELLIEKSNATHTTDRARLRGSRLVTTVETGEGRRWDMSTVKQLTGEDKICARFLFVDNIEFSATWSIVVATNHKPRILGHDRADWRRVLVVPFERTFDPGDPNLFNKLVEEAPQILGWLCKGAQDYLRDGLKVPQRILDEVDRYRKEQDVVGEFLEERTREEKEGFLERKRLFEDYRLWCGDSEFQFKRQAFYRIVGEREGWVSHKRSGVWGWIGHSLFSAVRVRGVK